MKLITPSQDPTNDYSTRMSTGDYVPYAYITTCERTFDVQGKAGEPNILLFLKDSHLELTANALQMRLPLRHFVFTPSPIDIEHGRWFHSAEFCHLFQHELAPISAFITDSNLKVVDFVDAQTLEELHEEAGHHRPCGVAEDVVDEQRNGAREHVLRRGGALQRHAQRQAR